MGDCSLNMFLHDLNRYNSIHLLKIKKNMNLIPFSNVKKIDICIFLKNTIDWILA